MKCVFQYFQSLKNHSVKVSVIGLGADVFILRSLCSKTNGQYQVVLDDTHYLELLFNHVKPRSVSKDTEATCVKMGFPHHSDKIPPITGCMWLVKSYCQRLVCFFPPASRSQIESFSIICSHIEDNIMNKAGYFCPQCNSKYCELPVECKTCGITLVTSAHLVRPLHHLIPINIFKDITISPADNILCYGCQKQVSESTEQVYAE